MGDKMNEIEEIRNRFKKRKGKLKPLDDTKFKSLYNTMIRFMVILIVGLFLASYSKTNEINALMSRVLDSEKYYIATNWIQTNLFSFVESEVVSQSISYVPLGEDEYTNYTNQVESLASGRVVYAGYQDMMGYYITVLLENNVQVTYSGMDTVSIDLYDRVEANQIIGTYQESIVLLFEYLGEVISYEEYQGME